ncbi:MAG: SPW repeat protein [Alicyclobacillus herbarius]|uniref:SPW repeat protein n=1 Tax=Alicyclobacillus herbarius TaxID=122960 RepID=UPI00040134BA|nr:SPW repeat protein [Alicyclobacillus herbarius]MCL6633286.1 SPW repeat protein [Alicyclobacillus herbarius]
MKWRSWITAAIGAWFVIAPWVLGVAHFPYVIWASVIFGLLQLVVSIWAAVEPRVPSWRMWQYWVVLFTGLWFLVEPFLGHYEVEQYWATEGPALLTIALTFWCLMEHTGWGPEEKGGSRL